MIQGETLAAFSTDPDHGSGWVMPPPHPLVEPATYEGKPLTFYYSKELAANPEITYVLVPPAARGASVPALGSHADAIAPGEYQHRGGGDPRIPHHASIRTLVEACLSTSTSGTRSAQMAPKRTSTTYRTCLSRSMRAGTGRATISTTPPMGGLRPDALSSTRRFHSRVPAYSTVCPPSFYPYTSQRALTEWAESGAPEALRHGIWAIPPRPLSDKRFAANIELGAGFSIDDDTVTALVSLPVDAGTTQSGMPETFVRRHVQLPDGMAGLFDPGWEVSQDRTADNRFFLVNHGLGTPFIEDAKLCATLSTFWPGVSPDSSREFQPDKHFDNAFRPGQPSPQ